LKPEVRDRTALWLPLVQRLTEVSPSWTIWKNADAAFAGFGDIDSAAPLGDWELILREFRRWAAQNGLGPVIECRHPPKTMFLLAVDPAEGELLELDVSGRKYFRGGTLFRAEDLAPLTSLDERGFRCLRPGAQALILLVTNGLRWGGRPDPAGLRKRRIPELLASDHAGVMQAAQCFGLRVRDVAKTVERLQSGGWDQRSMLAVEARALGRALLDPGILARRARFRLASKRSCPVLRVVFYGDRQMPGNQDDWLREVERTHAVYRERGAGDGE
jgi:hypothetical protein